MVRNVQFHEKLQIKSKEMLHNKPKKCLNRLKLSVFERVVNQI